MPRSLTRFNQFNAMSVCSPSRTTLMNGQNPARHRTTNWINPDRNNAASFGPGDWNWHGLQPGDVNLASLLRENGHATAHVGKAHFGPRNTLGGDPANLGFDHNVAGACFGSPGSYYASEDFGRDKRASYQVPHHEAYHGSGKFLTEVLTLESLKLRDQDWKVIYHYQPGKENPDGRYQLFHLAEDPFEQTNLASERPGKMREMMQRLIEELERHDALYPKDKADNELRPQLP